MAGLNWLNEPHRYLRAWQQGFYQFVVPWFPRGRGFDSSYARRSGHTGPGTRASLFPSTHWSVVLAAGGSGSTVARTAWDQLAQPYRQPVYNHARRRGCTHEDAQDLAQGFFARLIDKSALRSATPEPGRFRCFLLASFEHFLANAHDHRHALTRGLRRMAFVATMLRTAVLLAKPRPDEEWPLTDCAFFIAMQDYELAEGPYRRSSFRPSRVQGMAGLTPLLDQVGKPAGGIPGSPGGFCWRRILCRVFFHPDAQHARKVPPSGPDNVPPMRYFGPYSVDDGIGW